MENNNLEQYIKSKKKNETFSDMLIRLIREADLDETDVYKRAHIDRRHFSKIRSDRNYKPTLSTVVAFVLALRLDEKQSKVMIKSAGYILNSRSEFSLVIRYCIENRIYDLNDVNAILYEKGLPLL